MYTGIGADTDYISTPITCTSGDGNQQQHDHLFLRHAMLGEQPACPLCEADCFASAAAALRQRYARYKVPKLSIRRPGLAPSACCNNKIQGILKKRLFARQALCWTRFTSAVSQCPIDSRGIPWPSLTKQAGQWHSTTSQSSCSKQIITKSKIRALFFTRVPLPCSRFPFLGQHALYGSSDGAASLCGPIPGNLTSLRYTLYMIVERCQPVTHDAIGTKRRFSKKCQSWPSMIYHKHRLSPCGMHAHPGLPRSFSASEMGLVRRVGPCVDFQRISAPWCT
ncbi:uncharacterized protein MYCFIDRAFT_174805 [Pseudocercospora fijiensis CIRAD86]|uniref:Uncharacterized protein n=1 Tax=Pseudocercospora fijiensis (strain CIRAD86) TaxID=383855 RepID=M2ZWI1_PSEFD|nr:uncharacterized protein MYCFIDRAFT_174805 [Pseudocercospora fijiensis CIRAD86]EME83349.1 hypothetical protein MYCFIDRAFT_174805 [Pseudocercospora fijiensis CIRAD86]